MLNGEADQSQPRVVVTRLAVLRGAAKWVCPKKSGTPPKRRFPFGCLFKPNKGSSLWFAFGFPLVSFWLSFKTHTKNRSPEEKSHDLGPRLCDSWADAENWWSWASLGERPRDLSFHDLNGCGWSKPRKNPPVNITIPGTWVFIRPKMGSAQVMATWGQAMGKAKWNPQICDTTERAKPQKLSPHKGEIPEDITEVGDKPRVIPQPSQLESQYLYPPPQRGHPTQLVRRGWCPSIAFSCKRRELMTQFATRFGNCAWVHI